MSIKSVKVTMSKVNENVEGKQHKDEYMPIATIKYNEKGKPEKQVFLDNRIVGEGYFKRWNVGQSFFIGTTIDSYQIYDEEGNRTGTASIENGRIIEVNADYFVCLNLKTKWIWLINAIGFAFAGSTLTDEEVRLITE